MSARPIYWGGDAYVFDADGELVDVHHMGADEHGYRAAR